MGRRRPGVPALAAAAAAIPLLLLVFASTTASEDFAHDGELTRPGRTVPEPQLELSLLQLLRLVPDQPLRDGSAADGLIKSDALPASFDVNSTDTAASGGISTVNAACSYTVTIKTSCYSPRSTRDAISLYFGDAYGNQVYAARLDDPSSGTFERCSTDTFLVSGPCGYKTCYLYLQRSGPDGWAPDWVKVVSPYTRQAVTFYYNGYALPVNVWYGFNLCSFSSGGGGRAGGVLGAGWLWISLVVLVMLVQLSGLDGF